MKVSSIYEDAKDDVNAQENGTLTHEWFNRVSRRAENRLIDFLTGDVEDAKVPAPYLSQKNKDWLAFLIVEDKKQIQDGVFPKPKDYYQFENLYGLYLKTDCNSDSKQIVRKPIELLDGSNFNERISTDVEELKPENKPISKLTAKGFEVMPEDIGSAALEYIRYPKYAHLATKFDAVYHQDVPDDLASENYEWDEYAREILVWFIVDSFCNRNRDQTLKQFNNSTAKLVREQK